VLLGRIHRISLPDLRARRGAPRRHNGPGAVSEFQKILDHRAIIVAEPIGVLAGLQIARAYALAGDSAKAKSAYHDFLTLWSNADPDIPVLKEAIAESAKL